MFIAIIREVSLLTTFETGFWGNQLIDGKMLILEFIMLFFPKRCFVLSRERSFCSHSLAEINIILIYSRKFKFLCEGGDQALVGHEQGLFLRSVM